MKKILFFYLENCPYCIRAISYLADLKAQNPEFAALDIEMIEERREKQRADSYDYWYVPTLYVDGKKVHEGALDRAQLEKILRLALT